MRAKSALLGGRAMATPLLPVLSIAAAGFLATAPATPANTESTHREIPGAVVLADVGWNAGPSQ